MQDNCRILHGDAREVLKMIPDNHVQCCVTSPPYWGLRDYGVEGQLGSEASPAEFVENLVNIFREVRRTLKKDGTLWLNLGDSYYNYRPGKGQRQSRLSIAGQKAAEVDNCPKRGLRIDGLKEKDLVGIPWRVAFALQDDGWYLRSDIIWHKPNPMPESVTDRPTKSHEYIFLLTKNKDYYYNSDDIREPYGEDERASGLERARKYGYNGKGTYKDWYFNQRQGKDWVNKKETGDHLTYGQAKKNNPDSPPNLPHPLGKNKRSVWTVSTKAYPEAHFATYPPDLIKPCILAGSRAGDVILDPFNGSGTTGEVALGLGRQYLGIELNSEYIELSNKRLSQVTMGLPL